MYGEWALNKSQRYHTSESCDKSYQHSNSSRKSAPVYTTPTLTTSLSTIVQQPNSGAFQDFCDELYSTLLTCFSSVGKVRNQLAHERALAKFHCSRTGSLPAIWQRLFTKLNNSFHQYFSAASRELSPLQ